MRVRIYYRLLNSKRFFGYSRVTKQEKINKLVRPTNDSTQNETFLAPDWSPTATENDTWLRRIRSLSFRLNNDVYDTRFENNLNTISEDNASLEGKLNFDKYKFLTTGRMIYKNLGITDKKTEFNNIRIPLEQFKTIRAPTNKNHQGKQNFSDLRIIKVIAGKGGNGCISFFRDAGRPIGPPDGGDGGDGGSVYVQAVEGLNSLHKMKVKYVAEEGKNGLARQLDGAKGKDVIIVVPVGTTIRWFPNTELLKDDNEEENIVETVDMKLSKDGKYLQLLREKYVDDNWLFKEKDRDFHYSKDWFQSLNKNCRKYDSNLLQNEYKSDIFPIHGIDLDEVSKEPMLLVKGGKGGLGNMHFLTKDIRNPRFCKKARNGLELTFMFELKLLADFGLAGLPNSGKSTLLNAILNAKSKIGHWEFTTLQPIIGTVSENNEIYAENFSVADIPGIIKGAATDSIKPRGMGFEFLRHIERLKCVMLIISLENDPIHDFKILIEELKCGKDRLNDKRIMIVTTKADLVAQDDGEKFLKFKKYIRENFNNTCPIIPICATKRQNIDKLLKLMNQARSS